jgi:hypothetical protein
MRSDVVEVMPPPVAAVMVVKLQEQLPEAMLKTPELFGTAADMPGWPLTIKMLESVT